SRNPRSSLQHTVSFQLPPPSFLSVSSVSHISPSFFFFFNYPATTEIYTLSLHDALPISDPERSGLRGELASVHRPPRSAVARERSEEHTSELQSLAYLVCRLLLEKKKIKHSSSLCSTSTATTTSTLDSRSAPRTLRTVTQ